MKLTTIFLLALLAGCGPGITDGEVGIKNGYAYSDSGGNGKAITYVTNSQAPGRIVIQPRVDDYVVDGSKIIVARRPAEFVKRGAYTDLKLTAGCEYWMIDTDMHRVVPLADSAQWSAVHCN